MLCALGAQLHQRTEAKHTPFSPGALSLVQAWCQQCNIKFHTASARIAAARINQSEDARASWQLLSLRESFRASPGKRQTIDIVQESNSI